MENIFKQKRTDRKMRKEKKLTLTEFQKSFMASPQFQKILDDIEGQVKSMGSRTTAEIIGILNNYRLAYDMLMEHWECIPDEEKKNLDEQLKLLGL